MLLSSSIQLRGKVLRVFVVLNRCTDLSFFPVIDGKNTPIVFDFVECVLEVSTNAPGT